MEVYKAARPLEREVIQWLYQTSMRASELARMKRGRPGYVVTKVKGGRDREYKIPPGLSVLQGLTYGGIYRMVKAAGARAGMPWLSPHWIRHAGASECWRRGMSIDEIRDWLGHESVVTTLRYIHGGSSAEDILGSGLG